MNDVDVAGISENNHCIPNIDDFSGALFTLSLSILKLNSQYEEGVREINNIWYKMITNAMESKFKSFYLAH